MNAPQRSPAKANAATQSSGWKKQLERQSHFLPRPSVAATELANSRVHYLLPVAYGGATPVIHLYQQTKRKQGAWGTIKPLSLEQGDVSSQLDQQDRAALGVLIGNSIDSGEFAREYRDDYYAPSYRSREASHVALSPMLYENVLPVLAATERFVWMLSDGQDWQDAQPIRWDNGPAWQFRLRAESVRRRREWRLTGELVRGKQTRPLSDAIQCYASGLVLLDDQLARFQGPHDYRWVETLRENEHLYVSQQDRDQLLQELWRGGEPPLLAGDRSLKVSSQKGEPVGHLVVHSPEKCGQLTQRSTNAAVN